MMDNDIIWLYINGSGIVPIVLEYPPEDLVVRLGHFLFLENVNSDYVMLYMFRYDYIKIT